MRQTIVVGTLTLLMAGPVLAQQSKGVSVEGGDPDDRASARLLYWDNDADAAAGQLAINYGRPVWRKDYEDAAKFDAITKGKVWRMGSNFWSNLYADVPVKISGKSIAPGFYFLGLERSVDGSSWWLAFIDPVKIRQAHIDAFDIHKAAVEFTAPMNLGPRSPSEVEKLTITLTHSENEIRNAILKMAWGHLTLTAPVKVTVRE